MINIAIVEDNKGDSERLESFLALYSKETGVRFNIKKFPDPVPFLRTYRSDYDLIFLDIQMPNMNGMDAAKEIREIDKTVLIVFITCLGQCAIEGYQVEALDFVVKPIEYDEFKLKIERALCRIHKEERKSVIIKQRASELKIAQSDIIYVESMHHRTFFHTANETYKVTMPLSKVEKLLEPDSFARCNNCYLVNLKYVTGVIDHDCQLGDIALQISQPRKKEFLSRFIDYMEGK